MSNAVRFDAVRRLFSTFAHGAPGIGLLILRLTVGGMAITHVVMVFAKASSLAFAAFHSFLAALAVMLLVGLWTPIAATLMAVSAIVEALSHDVIRAQCVAVAFLSVALALIGPGAWSIDARLYGWKEIKISGRRQRPEDPSV
jgi:putative oxidoreductase